MEQISDYETLHPTEHVALQLRKRTNWYVAFACVAFCTYKVASYQEKSRLIVYVTREESYPDDVSVVELVRTCWSNMSEELKNAWNERAVFLNSLPVVGKFNHLPDALVGNLDEMARYSFQIECDIFKAKMKSLFLVHHEKSKNKKQVLMLPQEVTVGHKMHRNFPMSPLLRCVLFGKEKLHENYFHAYKDCTVNSSAKLAPAYLHISSPKRLSQIMTVSDVKLMVHESFDLPGGYCEHTLTSIASITNGSGRMLKAYGWNETRTSITFAYNDGRTTDPMDFVTFRRPVLKESEKIVVTKHGEERVVKYHKYDFSSVPPSREYNFVGFVPICIRVHSKNMNSSFSFVGGRIAYRKINDDVYLFTGYSS